ncbi:SDR family oxidoreductase [Alloacidobacterium dinghuense]|uniref:SDR family oxidoreductase n=1 Tax=Alloacidobacterium dinghuense TaxID=2763107 RepID=A0A7G8BE05_9BACT|nr:SDR family oxidoreductase [Alloacidobacterium dinghuense]QNI30775.1 SDR family oxidoreductase [Alloacidobacterium dinghuense]
MRIWITGTHGFIGRHLAAWLSRQGHEVAGIGHGAWPQSEAAAWGVRRWLNGEIHSSNLQQLAREGGAPDHVFHLAGGSSVGAAIANPREDFTRTVATTAELLEWMRLEAPKARIIAVSSAAVYGSGHSGHIREDQTHRPFSPYGYHKLMMENLCRSYAASYGLSAVVLRLFSVYGSWLKKQLLWDMCSRLSSNKDELKLGGTGEELRDWTDVRDVVRALELMMDFSFDSGATPIINAGSGNATSVSRIVELVLKCWPTAAGVTFSGESRPGDPYSLVADGSMLQAMGFRWNIPVDTGVHDFVQWYLQYSRSGV